MAPRGEAGGSHSSWEGRNRRLSRHVLCPQNHEDPALTTIKGHINTWIEFWEHLSAKGRRRAITLWPRLCRKVHSAPKATTWATTRGPVASIILASDIRGWQETKPTNWTDPHGRDWSWGGETQTQSTLSMSCKGLGEVKLGKLRRHTTAQGAMRKIEWTLRR